MLARCARCQGTFTTDRYGRQTCPHCGSELLLPSPPGSPPSPEGSAASPPAPQPPEGSGVPSPPASGTAGAGGGTELPPPPGPPPGGYGGPPSGFGPPPGGGWAPPPGGGWGPPPGPPPGPRGESPSPFADRGRLGFFHAFFETWKLVATQPEAFFSRVRVDQTGTAILFGIIATTVGTLFSSFYSWLSSRQVLGAMQGMLQGMSEEQSRFMRMWIETYASGALAAAQIVLTPILVFIASYVLAAFLHVMLKLFRGAHRGFDATLTVVGYVNGLGLLLAVPGCGSILVLVWTSIATIIGLAAVHRCSVTRATLAVLAPGVLLLVCCCGSLGGMLPALMKAGQEATKPGQTTTL